MQLQATTNMVPIQKGGIDCNDVGDESNQFCEKCGEIVILLFCGFFTKKIGKLL